MAKRINVFGLMLVAGALALSVNLFGCGGGEAQPAEPAPEQVTEQEKQQEAPAATTTENTEATTTEAAPTAEPAPAPAPAQSDSYIGDDEAKRIALNHAGVSEADAWELEVELDWDDVPVHYDVDFKSGDLEYDYDIDAVTGEIIYSNAEYDD